MSAKSVDEESENMASLFTQGNMKVDDFVRQYMELRTKYHYRQALVSRFNTDNTTHQEIS